MILTEAEEAEAQGVAHQAAFDQVAALLFYEHDHPEREATRQGANFGWRNSYDIETHPLLAAAHNAAHVAVDDFLADAWGLFKSRAYSEAMDALIRWSNDRTFNGYEYYVPRVSEATSRARADGEDVGNPRQDG